MTVTGNLVAGMPWSSDQAAGLDEQWRRAERRLRRAAQLSLVWLTVVLPLPLVLVDAGASYLIVPVALAAAIAAIAATEPPATRRLLAYLGIIGFAWSWTILLLVLWLQRSAGVVVLGPDGVEFLRAAETIVAMNFTLPRPSHEYFQILATGHYFVFAAVLYLLGPALFHLHVFNCAAASLLGPLTFAWSRQVYPRGALPAALLVTLFPSITYLAVVDLWKDPSVILATTLTIWALVHMCRDPQPRRLLMFGVIAAGCVWYLNTSRFYPAIYLEVGLIVAAIVALLHRRRISRGLVVAVIAVVGIGEGGPIARGWPGSPLMLVANVAHVLNVPSMRYYTAGLLDRARTEGQPPVNHPELRLKTLEGLNVGLSLGTSNGTSSDPRATASEGSTDSRPQSVIQVQVDSQLATSATFGSLSWMVHMIRRVYGPFVWILPPAMTARAWLGGLYLMYPGMLFWYALLPLMAAGFLVAGSSVVRGRQPYMVGVIWVYTALYSLQFLAMNLPVRQREAMFPVLAVFAVMGYHWSRGRPWATRLYVVYWIGLITMAVAHLVIRAQLTA
jgi:hypothetical protein